MTLTFERHPRSIPGNQPLAESRQPYEISVIHVCAADETPLCTSAPSKLFPVHVSGSFPHLPNIHKNVFKS